MMIETFFWFTQILTIATLSIGLGLMTCLAIDLVEKKD